MFCVAPFKKLASFLMLNLLLACCGNLASFAQTPSLPTAAGEKYVVALEFPLKVGTTNEKFTGKGIAVDASGNIYVSGSMAGAEEYSSDGTWKRSIGTGHRVTAVNGIVDDPGGAVANPAGGRMYFPFGITLDSAGNIYITDGLTECIQKFASDGSYLGSCAIPGKETDQGQPPNVTGIGVDEQGMIYLSDQTSDSVMKFGADGNYLASYGSKGKLLGQFVDIRFLAVDGDEIYAVDSLTSRIEVIKLDGTFVRAFGEPGFGDGQFTTADGVGVDGSHNVYVADGTRVEKFTKNGSFLANIRSANRGQSAGQAGQGPFASPLGGIIGIAVSKNGMVYVPDAQMRVVVFKPSR